MFPLLLSLQEARRQLAGVCHLAYHPDWLEKRIVFFLAAPRPQSYPVTGNAITSACFVATGANVTRCA